LSGLRKKKRKGVVKGRDGGKKGKKKDPPYVQRKKTFKENRSFGCKGKGGEKGKRTRPKGDDRFTGLVRER